MDAENRVWRKTTPKFPRSSIHNILRDRAYIGEIEHKGEWYPGKHEPLIDRATWDRVQTLLGNQNYMTHLTTFGGELIRCGHCGHPITGEVKTKLTKNGPKAYVYYRCARYTKPGHPRTRIPEAAFDEQILALFDKMRIEDEEVRDWFRAVLRSQTKDIQADSQAQRQELQRQQTLLAEQQDRLLNMRLADDVNQATYAKKSTEIRDRPRQSSFSLMPSTAHATKWGNSRPKCLNFRKSYARSGLQPIATKNVVFSKSSV